MLMLYEHILVWKYNSGDRVPFSMILASSHVTFLHSGKVVGATQCSKLLEEEESEQLAPCNKT